LNFVQDCKDVVSFFSYHLQEKAKLVKLQLAENKHQLVQPALLVGEVSSIARDEGK